MGEVSHSEGTPQTQTIEPSRNVEPLPGNDKTAETVDDFLRQRSLFKSYQKNLEKAAGKSQETTEPDQQPPDSSPEPIDQNMIDLSLQILAGKAADEIGEATTEAELKKTQKAEAATKPLPKTEEHHSLAETRPIDTSEVQEILKNAKKQEQPKQYRESPERERVIAEDLRREQEIQANKTVKDKIKELPGKIAWGTKIGITMIGQLGALHPWRSNGKWVWALEPWARTSGSYNQPPSSKEEKYMDLLDTPEFSDKKTVDFETNGGQNPNVRLVDGGIQLLDHSRIKAISAFGKRAVVNLKPASFNSAT